MDDYYNMFLTSSDKFKELIRKYPDWPIVFAAGENALIDGYATTVCTSVTAEEGEILMADGPCSDRIYTDESDFRDDMDGWLYDNWKEVSGRDSDPDADVNEYNRILNAEVAKYDDKWRDCIIVIVDN